LAVAGCAAKDWIPRWTRVRKASGSLKASTSTYTIPCICTGRKAVWQLLFDGHTIRNVGDLDLAPGAHQPLRHGWLREQACTRDVVR
jgi:hypothetical protein